MARQGFSIETFYFLKWKFFYQKKDVKNLRLKLNEKGEFCLSVPKLYPLEKVKIFLAKNEAWLDKTWIQFQNKIPQENEVYFLGKKYTLRIDENLSKTRITKNEIQSPSRQNFQEFLKTNARIIFSFYLKKWSKKTKLNYTHLSIKKMKTRWGSCNTKKAYINLNLRLLEKSLKAIEYVILHELSHIKHPNHNKEFYEFLHFYMSDFTHREKEFKP